MHFASSYGEGGNFHGNLFGPFKASRIFYIFQSSSEDYSINHDIGI